MPPRAHFRALEGGQTYPLTEAIYACPQTGSLLEVVHTDPFAGRSAQDWRTLFTSRTGGMPGPNGSGVWRYREWVLPDIPQEDIITLGEGATPLTTVPRSSEVFGVQLQIKQCGHSLSGSFKDLGMTVLVSQVNHLRRQGNDIQAVACASTGDTSAALAAYGAAAQIPTLVLLPKGKISQAQLVQPLASGARVIAIDTDFDGCMAHVARLCDTEGVYLANSKNSLRIEGQKTVAFEIAQGLGWQLPDWVAIPGGNLGNVSALVKGFEMLKASGLTDSVPRVLCVQVDAANPLYQSYTQDFAPLEPVVAKDTAASAIRIGDPVSFPRAVAALKSANGVVTSVSEEELASAAQKADACGFYLCPHTAVALAGVEKEKKAGTISGGAHVVVVSTAHGLKFTEFKLKSAAATPIEVADDYAAVVDAALGRSK